MVDRKKLEYFLQDLEDARVKINQLLEQKNFFDDFRNEASLKYLLILATEAMLNVCQHILAKHYRVAISSYVETFLKAGDYGIISCELANSLKELAELRNSFLIHAYWRCDGELLLDITKQSFHDCEKFIQEVKAWMQRQLYRREKCLSK